MQIRLIPPILFLSGFLLFTTWGCQGPLEPYYYPLDEFREGMVYEFHGTDPLDPPFYWHYRTNEQEGNTFLTGIYYDSYFTPYQSLKEEKVANGMLLVDYTIFDRDSTGAPIEVPVEIEGGNVYSFETPDPNKVLFSKVKFTLPSSPNTQTALIRNRQFRSDTTYTFGGEKYDAVVFYVRELIDLEDEGHAEHEYEGLEIYAKGLGLVYFEKNIDESFILAYALEERYSEEAFKEKYGVEVGD